MHLMMFGHILRMVNSSLRLGNDVGSISDISSLPEFDDGYVELDSGHEGWVAVGSSEAQQQHLPETWNRWSSALKRLLQIPMTQGSSTLRVGTLCSGTDSPIQALHEILGLGDCVSHVYSVDHWEVSRKFICANFEPSHMYKNVDDILLDHGANCCTCSSPRCRAYQEEVDLLVMGFPCKPFSSLNMSRYDDGYNPFLHPEAKPLFILQKFLKKKAKDKHNPKVIILENVFGLLTPIRNKKMAQRYSRPIDIILNGITTMEDDGQVQKYKHGLNFVKDYATFYCVLDALASGLPMRRRRVFIIMVRVDVYTQSAFDMFSMLFRKVVQHPLAPSPLHSFVRVETLEPTMHRLCRPKKKARTSASDADTSQANHGLLPSGPKAFSRSARPELLASMTTREVSVCDCIFDFMMKTEQCIPDDLIITVSESLSRKPWSIGAKIPFLSCGCKIYYHKIGAILNFATLFQIAGWNPDALIVPATITDGNLRKLVGNMVCVPTIGTIELLVLRCFFPRILGIEHAT